MMLDVTEMSVERDEFCINSSSVVSDVFQKVERRKRASYDIATLMNAVKDVVEGKMNSYRAADKYGIPRSTIRDWAKRAKMANF